MAQELPPIEELRKIFRADPETGKVYRLLKGGSEREVLGYLRKSGYLRLSFQGRNIRKHRLVFALVTGDWPKGEIDHVNGDKTDNRICNLRDVSRRDNCRNMPMHKRNKSGQSGVHYNAANGKWLAKIGQHGTDAYEYLGVYENLEDAITARKAAEARHGYHENHGRS